MKSILFVPGFNCDTFCTIENKTLELSEELSKDYNIILLAPEINSKYAPFTNKNLQEFLNEPAYVTEARRQNINIITANLSKFNLIKNILILNKIFKDNNIEAIMTEFGYERFVVPILTKFLGKKTIYYEHLNPLYHKRGKVFVFLKLLFYKIFVDEFITMSNFIANVLPKNKPVHVIMNAIEIKELPEISEKKKSELRKNLKLDKFDHVVVMIAAFRVEKRHDLAIKIIETVKQRSNKNIGFVFLGASDFYDKYANIIKDKNLQDRVIMPGHVNNVDEYLMIADLHMLTSESESFGLCLLDAMNYKLPLIAFDIPATRQIIDDKVNGYIIPFGNCTEFANKIIELVENKEHSTQLGENGYKKLIEKFNMKTWRKKMKSCFDKILA